METRIKSAHGDGLVMTQEYVADVTGADGASFRAVIQEPTIATDFWAPHRGDVVKVLYDARTQKVKFDKSDPQLSHKAHKRSQADAFERAAGGGGPQSPDAPPASLEALGAALAQAASAADGGSGRGDDPGARLAKLEALRGQGLVGDAEYERLRRRILDSI